MNRLKTLRVRFALWTAGVLLAALGLFGLYVYVQMSLNLTAALDETLRLNALQLMVDVEIRRGEVVSVENSFDRSQYARLQEQGFSLRIWNPSGQVVEEYGPYRDWPQPTAEGILAREGGTFRTVSETSLEEPMRLYTVPITESDHVVGILQVAQTMETVNATLRILLVTLLIGVPAIVIVAGGSGYFLAARALAPIDKITRAARHISAQDLSARLDLAPTDDEVGRLAATFDSMLARLDEGFQRERQFTADTSHELRTPLSAMQTIIDTTLSRRRATPEYEQALTDLSHEAEQMRTLTEGLLLLARNDPARQQAKFQPVDLSNLLKDLVDSFRTLAEEKGLEVVDRVPQAELTLMGDSDGLIRLFVNLLDNAIKYTEHGTITISAAFLDDRSLTVTISDTGVGIAADHIPAIFDRFYRVDESRSTDGIGLGLAIVRDIARAHGGDVTVASTPGQGTAFVVELLKAAGSA